MTYKSDKIILSETRYRDIGFDAEQLYYDLDTQFENLLIALIAMRHKRGLSTSDVAKRMHISEHAIIALENDNLTLSWEIIRNYAVAVGAYININVQPAQ